MLIALKGSPTVCSCMHMGPSQASQSVNRRRVATAKSDYAAPASPAVGRWIAARYYACTTGRPPLTVSPSKPTTDSSHKYTGFDASSASVTAEATKQGANSPTRVAGITGVATPLLSVPLPSVPRVDHQSMAPARSGLDEHKAKTYDSMRGCRSRGLKWIPSRSHETVRQRTRCGEHETWRRRRQELTHASIARPNDT